ncbi:sialic acid-binding Ig-like lectin 15 [Stegastes partitus]|uniref:Sialic acid-binding Ig-like lectin 15 n=1 Tax=Stegastes partitus TaxID=144197 RepID=A0A9Y4KI24_9TELE|nr:PREDICTED: sialic acid-binding Ig-like lectin 15 [Stegastes partitus]
MTVSPVVTVSRGEDAVLNCSFTHGPKGYSGKITVKWLARDPKTEPFFKCSVTNDSMEAANECSGSGLKYSLDGDPRRGQLSLLIRKVELLDNGTFFCRVELDRGKNSEKKIDLFVELAPQIPNLSVVEAPCGSDSTPRSLRCEVEGHPLPKVVYLSVTKRLLEVQVQTLVIGPYSRTTCIPYLQEQEEEVTCRAESRLGEAERTYPTTNHLMIILTVCGVVVLLLLLLSAGITIYCLKTRNPPPQDSEPPAAREIETVYSELTIVELPHGNSVQQREEAGVIYSLSVH